MKFSVSAASHVGCVRQNNEDMILVQDKFIRNGKYWTMADTGETDRYLIALADGMGGHNSGEVASSDVLHNLQFFYSDLPSGLKVGDFNETIYEWLASINNIIDAKGHTDPKYLDMGTTLVALAFYNGSFYWMNCGDSRMYRLRDESIVQLTTDHSLNTLMGSSEHTNIITNCIGAGCTTSYIDMMQLTNADIQSGDIFLLCSDGLSDMVTDDQIYDLLVNGADATKLCLAAESAGGLDNVSACVVKIV